MNTNNEYFEADWKGVPAARERVCHFFLPFYSILSDPAISTVSEISGTNLKWDMPRCSYVTIMTASIYKLTLLP